MNTASLPVPDGLAASHLSVGDTLNIYSVEALRAAWATELERATAIALDLSTVTTCDSLGIQLLVATRRTAERRHKIVVFANPSPAVRAAAAAVACEALFNSDPLPR